jgi:peptidoglycan hydrolase-like protein with peptidoglycan-binding domain
MDRLEFDIAPFAVREETEAQGGPVERGRNRTPQRVRPPTRRPPPAPPHFAPRPAPRVCPTHGTEFVRWVQSALNRVEGSGLPVDGKMSSAARSAVRRFQRRRRLRADGIVGPETEQALREARRPAQPQPEPTRGPGEIYEFETLDLEFASSMPTLRQGSRGSAVADLQRRLDAAGFSPGPADGVFGPLTDTAVRSFQRAKGLGIDGIVGPQTWGALLGTSPSLPHPYIPWPQPAAAVPISWGARVTPAFRDRVRQIAARFGVDPGDLMSVMAFETNETFNPATRNELSGATGLIQFIPPTIRALGTTTDALAAMTAEAQLDYVERYFAGQKQPLRTLEDLYMAVLWPPAIGQPNEAPIFVRGDVRTGVAYSQNSGLDSDGDGRITKAEAAAFVRAKRAKGDRAGYAG